MWIIGYNKFSHMSQMVDMLEYYNLRFGYCDNNSESDFIDNINGKLNIHIAKGYDEYGNSSLGIFISFF